MGDAASDASTAVVWFDRDLRLGDHPALVEACREFDVLVPVYVADEDRAWAPSEPQRHWLRGSLEALDGRFRSHGLQLIRRSGDAPEELARLAGKVEADAVYWSRRYGSGCDDGEVADALEAAGVAPEPRAGRLLHDPDEVETTSGGPYHVYTPFRDKLEKVCDIGDPLPVPDLGAASAPDEWPSSEPVDALFPETDGTEAPQGWRDRWRPGAAGARERLETFVESGLAGYDEARDRLASDGTSRLSPHLHFGEISPRQIWATVDESSAAERAEEGAETFLDEIVWREFAYHMFHHYPETATEPLKEKFRGFDWVADGDAFERWSAGRTGYPVVDAGMRQLRETGWMHNRARMIVASFMTKDLRLPWQWGAEFFWDHLVDADLPNNTMGWQWAAGCGADAQPFFRIFNPVTQGESHDPDATYVQRWVPELRDLEAEEALHPWQVDDPGLDYPERMVDHSEAREEALEAWEAIK